MYEFALYYGETLCLAYLHHMCYNVHMRRAAASTSTSATITVRLPTALKRRIERLAKASRRSKSFLTLEAIENYLDVQEWQMDAIKEGIQAADEGRVVSHEQVKAWLLSWGTDQELSKPTCK